MYLTDLDCKNALPSVARDALTHRHLQELNCSLYQLAPVVSTQRDVGGVNERSSGLQALDSSHDHLVLFDVHRDVTFNSREPVQVLAVCE
jgi:hypothetical protein